MRTIKVFIFSAILAVCSLCAGAQELSFKGTFNVMKTDDVFTVEDVVFNIKLNPENNTASFHTVGMCFGNRMPRGLTIDFDGVKYTQEGETYTFEIEVAKPTNEGKPFGATTLKNLTATADATSINAMFDVGKVFAQFDGEKF